MQHRNYCLLSAVVFALAASAHALRLARHWTLQVGPVTIPPALSWLGLVLAVVLSVWGFRVARR